MRTIFIKSVIVIFLSLGEYYKRHLQKYLLCHVLEVLRK